MKSILLLSFALFLAGTAEADTFYVQLRNFRFGHGSFAGQAADGRPFLVSTGVSNCFNTAIKAQASGRPVGVYFPDSYAPRGVSYPNPAILNGYSYIHLPIFCQVE